MLAFAAHAIGTASLAQDSPRIIVARQILLPPQTVIPFPIQLENTDTLPANAFIRVRDLPEKAKLTVGYRVSQSTWAVPLYQLARLRIAYPEKVPPETTIRVQLVSLDGTVHADEGVALIAGLRPIEPPRRASRDLKRASEARLKGADVIAATAGIAVGNKDGQATERPPTPAPGQDQTTAAAVASTTNQKPPVPAPVNTAAPQLTPQQRAASARLLQKGNRFLLQGNINAARLFYRRAADSGMAAAAMALAATYDPNELGNLGIVGLPGDPEEARIWYQRAAELGDKGAAERLARLGTP
jgi:hypothetical protein